MDSRRMPGEQYHMASMHQSGYGATVRADPYYMGMMPYSYAPQPPSSAQSPYLVRMGAAQWQNQLPQPFGRRGKDTKPRKRRNRSELSDSVVYKCPVANCSKSYFATWGRYNLKRHIKVAHPEEEYERLSGEVVTALGSDQDPADASSGPDRASSTGPASNSTGRSLRGPDGQWQTGTGTEHGSDSRHLPGDPRAQPGESDPRGHMPAPVAERSEVHRDPRSMQGHDDHPWPMDPRAMAMDPRGMMNLRQMMPPDRQRDPRQMDPRMRDPRQMPTLDPRQLQLDPRYDPRYDPRGPMMDHRLPADPRMMDPRSHMPDPWMQDPRLPPVDPWMVYPLAAGGPSARGDPDSWRPGSRVSDFHSRP